MEWLWGAALLPLLFCGLMCVGGVAIAAVPLRRGTRGLESDERVVQREGDHR